MVQLFYIAWFIMQGERLGNESLFFMNNSEYCSFLSL